MVPVRMVPSRAMLSSTMVSSVTQTCQAHSLVWVSEAGARGQRSAG